MGVYKIKNRKDFIGKLAHISITAKKEQVVLKSNIKTILSYVRSSTGNDMEIEQIGKIGKLLFLFDTILDRLIMICDYIVQIGFDNIDNRILENINYVLRDYNTLKDEIFLIQNKKYLTLIRYLAIKGINKDGIDILNRELKVIITKIVNFLSKDLSIFSDIVLNKVINRQGSMSPYDDTSNNIVNHLVNIKTDKIKSDLIEIEQDKIINKNSFTWINGEFVVNGEYKMVFKQDTFVYYIFEVIYNYFQDSEFEISDVLEKLQEKYYDNNIVQNNISKNNTNKTIRERINDIINRSKKEINKEILTKEEKQYGRPNLGIKFKWNL